MTPLDAVSATAAMQAGCIARHQALRAGLGAAQVDHLVRGGHWRALFSGVYLVDSPGSDPDSPLPYETRLCAAMLWCGPAAVACLDAAAHLHGLPTPAGERPSVQICLPPRSERHQHPGVELHFRDVGLRDVCRRGLPGVPGLPVRCTTVVQTAADALRTWSEWDSVSLLDAALSRGDLPANWPDAIEERIYRMRGAVAARKRLALADGRSESPLETRVRLIAAACERAPDALQYEVHDARGILLGRADMAWHRADGRLLVAECDGRMWHEAPQAVFRDRHRTNAFSGVGGIDVVRFTWADTARPAYIRRVLDQHLDGRWSRQHAPRAG